MISYTQPGTVLTDHLFAVPLDHERPDGEQIEVFAREIVAAGLAGRDDIPWLLYLQGGPGAAAPRTVGRESWLDRALRDYRVLLLDQRGTGRSTPVDAATLTRRGAGGIPDALPGRQHRPGRGTDPAVPARRGSVERARPVVRRVLRGHVPVVRAARSA